MKKFLSLALALVMTMSLVTISAGATFTDDSAIEYIDAVDVMAALEIVGGYANGSFDPTATLTRGAAAKIICNLILTPAVASTLGDTYYTTTFSDVPADHTFAGYIGYCANKGIVSGYDDGTFRPAGTITGFAFMKMLLGALGYDADVEEYTGAGWSVNVSTDAKKIGLDDGNEDYVGSQALTREEACLYAMNTLMAETVTYDSKSSVTVGDIVISNNSEAKTSGVASKVDYLKTTHETTFMDENFSKLDIEKGYDNFGRTALVWSYKGDEIGTYASGDDLEASYVGSVSKGTLYSLIGADLYEELEDSDATLTVKVDGKTVSSSYGSYFTKNSSSAASYTGNSVYTEVYVDEGEDGVDDTAITIIIINTYLVQAADDYDADDEELEIETIDADEAYTALDGIDDVISNDDINVELFEEDDYILLTIGYDGDDYVVMSAELAETLQGAVTTYTNNSSVTVDGTKYSYNKIVADKSTGFEIGEDTVLVIDQYGNVIYVDEATTATDGVVFVEAYGSTKDAYEEDTIYAKLYFVDGTYVNAELDQIGSKDADASKDESYAGYEALSWYTYTENDDGTYDLGTVSSSDYNTTTARAENKLVDGKINYIDTDTELKANSSTVFIIKDSDGDLYTYTGIANVPYSTKSVKAYALENTNDYSVYVFIDAGVDNSFKGTSTDATDYMMIMDVTTNKTQTEEDETVYQVKVLIDGEVETMYAGKTALADYDISDSAVATSVEGKVFYDVTVDEYGYIDDAVEFVDTESSADDIDLVALELYKASYSENILSVGSTGAYIFGDDTVVYVYGKVAASGTTNDLAASVNDYSLLTYTSIGSLSRKLDDYAINGTAYAVLADDASEEIAVMFICVDETYDADQVVGDIVIEDQDAPTADDRYDTPLETAGVKVEGYSFEYAEQVDLSSCGDLAHTDEEGDTYYYVGLVFEKPVGATKVSVFFGDEDVATYANVNLESDGAQVVGGQFIEYFAFANEDGSVMSSASWDMTFVWANAEGDIAITTATVERA